MKTLFPIDRIRNNTFPPPPSIAETENGVDPNVARMHFNEAPFGPSPLAIAAAVSALESVYRYPDHGCTGLASVIAARTSIAADRIAFGNGSSELLIALAMMAIADGNEAVVPTPTFPTCLKGVQIAGGKLVEVPGRPDGANDIPAMLSALSDNTRLVYLCTPNNPTGNIIAADELARAAKDVPDTCLLVIDEAYSEFAAHEGGPDVLSILADRTGPWAVTRSFSKAYCMAGMRVGYALTSGADVQSGLEHLRSNFNVNRVALAAATAAMQDEEHLRMVLDYTIAERNRMADAIERTGFSVLPSFANFVTIFGPTPAKQIAAGLADTGILVQHMAWPNKNGSLRITVDTAANTDRLVSALEAL
ncbi:MAG: aminotransferase class I/II-fold pyridoxal phosphate-dependent enzyme, partial [Hyphomicrobiales bacterium]|nr:aminotransferase class I/II-fold pyridoxal phosphate-dependent enzyme [Hyphomicrobiales bacterium]